MKAIKLSSLVIIILIMNSCFKECPEGLSEHNEGLDKINLPYIIPYSDTSTMLFLKNGKDTLLFKSEGLKESYEFAEFGEIGGCNKYKLQKFTLKMAASETDYISIHYYTGINWGPSVKLFFNLGESYKLTTEYSENNFIHYTDYKIVKKNILNTMYDSINSLSDPNFEEIYFKPKIGLLKVKTSKFSLELIN
jgi:hypothetical protein